MNPALPDLLTGVAIAIATPPPPESAGDYMAGRLGILAMISGLAAQEAQAGPAARLSETAMIRALIDEAAADHPAVANAAKAMLEPEGEATWAGLDLANAAARRGLIALHEAVEAAGDRAWDRRILELYVTMAEGRRLRLPGE